MKVEGSSPSPDGEVRQHDAADELLAEFASSAVADSNRTSETVQPFVDWKKTSASFTPSWAKTTRE